MRHFEPDPDKMQALAEFRARKEIEKCRAIERGFAIRDAQAEVAKIQKQSDGRLTWKGAKSVFLKRRTFQR
jgi:hypothetical protein